MLEEVFSGSIERSGVHGALKGRPGYTKVARAVARAARVQSLIFNVRDFSSGCGINWECVRSSFSSSARVLVVRTKHI